MNTMEYKDLNIDKVKVKTKHKTAVCTNCGYIVCIIDFKFPITAYDRDTNENKVLEKVKSIGKG